MRGMSPPPLPPKSTSTTSIIRGHLRRRSQQASNTAAEVESLMAGSEINLRTPRPTDDTVVEFGQDHGFYHPQRLDDSDFIEKFKIRDDGAGFDDDGSGLIASTRSPGHLMWQDKKLDQRRKSSARCLGVFLLVASALTGWIIGVVAPPGALSEIQRSASGGGAQNGLDLLASGLNPTSATCNPYDQYGILNVSTTVASENVWEPISAPSSCQPVNYMSMLAQAIRNNLTVETVTPELEFVVNRTIVIFGDSVDRDHNEHFCALTGGFLEMIGVNHTLSPAYPVGDEIPPEGYKNFMTGTRDWPNFDQSRPYVCHVGQLGLRIINVFHYGFRGRTKMIENHPHFYPPATIEERFDQIVVPLVRNVAQEHGVSTTPDLVSFTPGYWGLLRQAVSDDKMLLEAIKNGTAAEEAQVKYDVWRTMAPDQREWNRERMNNILRHIGRGWFDTARKEASNGAARSPMILWRALHHIKEQHNLPYNRVQALDQIGRSVVEQLIRKGRAAEAGSQIWAKLVSKLQESLGRIPSTAMSELEDFKTNGTSTEERQEALEMGYSHRLKIDEWGALMRGQERYFRDNVHPLPLPGSYLYGNMLMQQLKMMVDEEPQRADE